MTSVHPSDGLTPAPSNVQRSDTARVEQFSDGVFAIVITLLVLNLQIPEHAEGQLLTAMVEQWPAYLSYFGSFFGVGVIWLNHHAAFMRIGRVDKGLQFANLSLLFTTALIPFPTAVVSRALVEGINGVDAATAVAFYALAATAMCVSWLLLYTQAHRHYDHLAERGVDRTFFTRNRKRAIVGVCCYLGAGIIGALVMPIIALGGFVLLPVFYAVSIR
jgi:uncharacterized membrane protein